MQQVKWDETDINVLHCPKCDQVGGLRREGMDVRKRYHRFYCKNCQNIVTELQLLNSMPEVKATPKLAASSNNSVESRLNDVEKALSRLTALLEGKAAEPAGEKPEPGPITEAAETLVKPWEKWDKYSLETQDRIGQELLPVIRDHPDWSASTLQAEVKKQNRYGRALRLQVIIEVRDAFIRGVFGL